MITVALPRTNGQPQWLELREDGRYIGKIRAHAIEVNIEPGMPRLMLRLADDNGLLLGYLWADEIHPLD
jgi:hypothetical protein